MPELPPQAEVLDALKFAVLPAVVAALLAFNELRATLGRAGVSDRRSVPLAASAALLAALLAGNLFRGAVPFVPDGRWWHWIGPAVAVAMAAEVGLRAVVAGPVVSTLVRAGAAGLVGWAATPAEWREGALWAAPAVGAGVLAVWAAVAAGGRHRPGLAAAAVTVVAGGVSAVLLHNKTLGFADVATILFAGLAVLAFKALVTGDDTSAAAAAAVVPLTAYLVAGRHLSTDPVPGHTFVLAALAPLPVGLLAVPGVRHLRWLAVAVGLLLPVALASVAAGLAMAAAPLEFGEGW